MLYGATGHTDLAGIQQSVTSGEADAILTTFALVMLVVAIFVFVNLMVDLAYAWLDPRISYDEAS